MTGTIDRRADTAPAPGKTYEELAAAVDASIAAAALLDGPARAVTDALRAAIEAAHRAALVTIVRRLRSEESTQQALFDLVDDPLIHLLFSLHGLIRPDPMTAARAALEDIRPGLQSHGGDVDLVRIDEGIAYVRLSGACNGCSMSSVTMRTTVEEALRQVASISSVQVLPSEPSPAVIPLSAVRRRVESPEEVRAAGWVQTVPIEAVLDGTVTELQVTNAAGAKQDVIVVRIGASMTAYRDECAHQGLPLGNATLDVTSGTLTCPWHGFCFEALTGDCVSAPGAALEQLPLRIDAGYLWIRVGP